MVSNVINVGKNSEHPALQHKAPKRVDWCHTSENYMMVSTMANYIQPYDSAVANLGYLPNRKHMQ